MVDRDPERSYYTWPGNIRELQDIIERAVILSLRSVLELDGGLPPTPIVGRPTAEESLVRVARAASASRAALSQLASLEELERSHIQAVLEQTGGVIEGPKGD